MLLTSLTQPSQLFAAEKKCITLRAFLAKTLNHDHFTLYTKLLDCDNERVAFDDLLVILNCKKENGLRRLKNMFPDEKGWTTESKPTKGRPEARITLTRETSQDFCSEYDSPMGRNIAKFFRTFARAVVQYDKLQLYMQAREFKHNTLIEANAQWPLVYLADVFVLEQDQLVVYKKIGCTQDIANRQLTRDMHATCTFTHVFRCIRALPLEQDILKIPVVVKHLHKPAINGHVSRETIKFSDEFQETDLIQLIKERVDRYNVRSEDADLRTQEIALATTQAELEQERMEVIKNATRGRGPILNQQYIIASPPGCPGIYYEQKSRKNGAGYRVQRIDPASPEHPMTVYDSAKDACCKIRNASQSRIMAAIDKHTLYMGSRWCTVAHDLDPNVVHDLPPLQQMRVVTQGMVAKLDQNYVIKEVFRNQLDATKEAQLKSRGAISIAVKRGTLSRGHFYKLWDNCTETEQAAYVTKFGEPETPENPGIRVSRQDNAGQTFAIYANVETVVKEFRMGRQTLYDAIKNKTPAKGWFWTFTDPQDKQAHAGNVCEQAGANTAHEASELLIPKTCQDTGPMLGSIPPLQ